MKLIVKNFQAQRYLELELSPGINTIVGDSDVGKSSTIRALNWLLMNENPCRDFITWGEDECSVTIEDIDGHTISRVRNDKKKKNIYVLDGQEFASLRQNVPPEISNILKIVEDNFQFQHDLPFWFSNTGGELAKKLNKIINLDVVDFTFNELQQDIKKIKATRTVYETRIEERKESKEILPYLETFKTAIDRIQNLSAKIGAKEKEKEILSQLITDSKDVLSCINKFEEINEKFKCFLEEFDEFDLKKKQFDNLQYVLQKINQVKVFDLSRMSSNITSISELFNQKKKNEKEKEAISSILDNIREYESKIGKTNNKIAAIKKEIDQALQNKCPYCGRTDRNIVDGCYVEYSIDDIMKDLKK